MRILYVSMKYDYGKPALGYSFEYTPGKEVVCFHNTDDLISKIRYYSEHEDERQAIAQVGYERTLREHTYSQRFNSIFQQMNLPQSITAEEKFELGQTIEIFKYNKINKVIS